MRVWHGRSPMRWTTRRLRGRAAPRPTGRRRGARHRARGVGRTGRAMLRGNLRSRRFPPRRCASAGSGATPPSSWTTPPVRPHSSPTPASSPVFSETTRQRPRPRARRVDRARLPHIDVYESMTGWTAPELRKHGLSACTCASPCSRALRGLTVSSSGSRPAWARPRCYPGSAGRSRRGARSRSWGASSRTRRWTARAAARAGGMSAA